MIVRFELTEDGFRCIDAPVLANTSSINYIIAHFIIKDKTWEGTDAITAVFKSATYNKVSEVMLDQEHRCYLDPEVYKKGGTIQVKLIGDRYLNDQTISSTNTSEICSFYIKENVIIPTPIPSKYEVVIAELSRAETAVEDIIELVETKLENGDFDGADGADGVGISNIEYNADGTLDITLTDGTTFTSEYSMKGQKGDTGNGIASITYGEDGTVIIVMTDGTQFESDYSMKGEKGDTGDTGESGNGITSITKTGTSGLVDTYTVEFDDLTTTTFEVTNGEKGDKGDTGSRGPQGETGATGATGAAAGFGTVSASVDANTGTPAVSVSTSGPDTAKNMTFAFSNLKGAKGDKGDPGDISMEQLQSAFIRKSINSASLLNFPDGANNIPVKDLNVDINPVQDLHGYSKPWAGGAGKNKLPLSVSRIKEINTSGSWSGNAYTLNGVTFTITTDSDGNVLSITVQGTAPSSRVEFNLALNAELVNLVGESYKVNGCTGGSITTYGLQAVNWDGANSSSSVNGDSATITPTNSFEKVRINVYANTTVNNAVIYPMIRLVSETDASFEPYSNICPISGWTECNIGRTGINAWDEEWENGGIYLNDGTNSTNTSFNRSKNYIPVKSGETYYIKCPVQMRILFYDKDKAYLGQDASIYITNNTFTVPSDACYIRFRNNVENSWTPYNHDISINYPSTDTAYHAYNSNIFIIDLDGTRYGGTLDVTSGVMVLKYGRVIFDYSTSWFADGDNRWATGINNLPDGVPLIQTPNSVRNIVEAICNLYAISNQAETTKYSGTFSMSKWNANYYIYFSKGDFADAVAFKNWVTDHNIEVVYELATPLTVQLTPTQVATLLGENNIWCNTGDCSIEYYADATIVISDLTSAILALGNNV